MGFQVAVRNILAGVTLVAEAIQSQNYQAGVSGFRLGADGFFEANNALFRGDFQVGTALNGVDIGSTIPAELSTYYSTNYGGSAINATIRFTSTLAGVTNYYYMIEWDSPQGVLCAMAWVDSSLQVHEGYLTVLDNTSAPGIFFGHTSPMRLILGGDIGGVSELDILLTKMFIENILNIDTLSFAGDILLNNVSIPRGLAYAKQMNGSPVATSTGGVETIITTLASYTYRHDRMYRFSVHGQAAESVATILTYRLRRGPGLGGQLIATWAINHPTAQGQEDSMWAYISNNTGSDLTEQVVLTFQAGGTTNATFSATGAGQGQLLCEDVGALTAFTGGSSANW